MIPFLSNVGVLCGLGLIFDLDGVLIDSNPVHSRTWRVYLKRNGRETPQDFDRYMFGRRNDDIVRWLFGSSMSPAEVARHGTAKEALYREIMGPVLSEHLVPGLVAFLEQHRGTPMGVATNAERANADFVLDDGGLRPFFPVVVHGEQVVRPKPDPEVYLRAAELLGITPGNCVVFEDSLAGVEAARAAGSRVVGLTTTHDRLPGVDLTVRDYTDAELAVWLSRQRPVE